VHPLCPGLRDSSKICKDEVVITIIEEGFDERDEDSGSSLQKKSDPMVSITLLAQDRNGNMIRIVAIALEEATSWEFRPKMNIFSMPISSAISTFAPSMVPW
jgi:hypothetical protein